MKTHKIKNSAKLLICLACFGLLNTIRAHAQNDNCAAVEENGVVAVEAESFVTQSQTSKRKWYVQDGNTSTPTPDPDGSHAGSSSKRKYIEILPDTRVTHDDKLIKGENFSETPGELGVLEYKIKFKNPGRYYVWVRAHSTGSEDNGVHVGLNGNWPNSGRKMQWCKGKNQWTWESKQRTNANHCGEEQKIYLDIPSAGIHRVMFSMREDGFEFDKFVLSKAYNKPSGEGPAMQLTDCTDDGGGGNSDDAVVSGELKKWHKVTLTFDGPNSSETANDNPFLNYRLNVTFTHQSGSPSYVVPGYFAADGNAAQTSAKGGNKWRAHFAPDKIGKWNYTVSFRKGTNVAVSDSNNAGSSAGFMNGDSGSFTITASNKSGRDFRAKGRLQYVGEHYLRFAETGKYMIKQGPDSPENLFAYDDFDNTSNSGNRRKSYQPHKRDWKNGDPTWKNGKGKGLIGAVNYIASEGLNSMSFLTMNINGDDKNVYPYIGSNERTRMDVSKLDQWAIVIEHMQKNGIFAHFKTQETENETLLDNGNTGTQRKLYYRELIARFGHNLALNWNLGEENGAGPQKENQTASQQRAMAAYFHENDPYRHHIVIHTYPNDFPDQLIGNKSKLSGFSLQTNKSDFRNVFGKVKEAIDKSRGAGRKWAVACDEPGDATHAIRPDNNAANSHTDGRKNAIWATLLAGGWGNEWYFGYENAHSDLSLQDFRSRDKWWDYTRYAIQFFELANLPLTQMRNDNSLSSSGNDYCYAKAGEAYVVYLKNGGSSNLNLNGHSGKFTVKWYDPRNGGSLQNGSVRSINGGGNRSIGNAPNNSNKDWVILITKEGADTGENEAPSVAFTTPSGNITVQEEYTDLAITVNASDSDGTISNVRLYVDGNLIRQENIAPYNWGIEDNTAELLGLSVGEHIFKAVATDDDGATSEDTFTLKVEREGTTTAPQVSFKGISEDITVQEGYDLEVEAMATDANGTISNVKLYIDNRMVRQENFAPYNWGHEGSPDPEEINGLSAGTYTIKAVATDNDGNTGDTSFRLIVQGNQPIIANLAPIHDAYLQGSTGYNTVDLRVESENRTSYLLFDLGTLSGAVSSAELKLTVSSDPGNGQIKVYLGNGTNWTENNISNSNKPSKGQLLAAKNTSYSTNKTYNWNLNDGISTGGKVCLIVEHASGNDVSFWSKEGNKKPELTVTTNNSRQVNALSTKETTKVQVSMHPNPARDVVFLRNLPETAYLVKVYGFNGYEVVSQSIHKTKSTVEVNINKLPAGMYFVKVYTSKEGTSTTRLLKE
ncbi:DUF5060 domain-containing protein [Aquimarina sp. U1-2]|uniref:DUF5060 domain-containing protein n=1 Tax=Aquimarina sp. U1-2 TaxID=2823141 RepID=UPI001AECE057|nr:DUF5060 domain-containing protein [Aquimarina sp. U1-2]MBP2833220.1 DUF5060 domain-containing protein [Aquimarina sp. U1-2]